MTPSPTRDRRRTVRAFLLSLVLVCLLPGVLGAGALFAWQYRQARAEIERTTILSARAMTQAVDFHLLKVMAVAQALATSQALRAGHLATFHAEAGAAMREIGLGTNVVLRDAAGRQILNTVVPWGQPLVAPPAPQRVRDVFRTGQPTISDMFFGPVLKRPVMSIDVPVVVEGQVRYALGIGVLPEQFNAILQRQQLPPKWVAAIVDRQGTLAGRSLAPERFVGTLAAPTLRMQMQQRREGAGEAITLEGTQVFLYHSRSPATGWTVAIGVPRQALDATFAHTSAAIAGGVAALFALGGLLAWRISGHIERAFRVLTGAVADLGAGRQPHLPALVVAEADEVARGLQDAAGLLEERRHTLLEADRRKDEFISVLAHELRNPLAPVRSAVEILRLDSGLAPRSRRARDILDRQVQHMARLIDDLLDVSRIASGKMALRRERCDLAQVVQQTADDYRHSVEEAGLTLSVDVAGPLWVDGDPVRLAQMTGNLLNNAVRFTERGGQVTVRAWADGATAAVRVSDTGVGLSPAMLARLFDPFSQAGQDLARSKGGLGLGLALTRGLVQLHGGHIEARSEGPGRGAHFTLWLPLMGPGPGSAAAVAARGPSPSPSPSPEPSSARTPAPPAPSPLPASTRILVIEDNEDAALTLSELLTLVGYEVRVALNGEQALAQAQAFAPQAVVCDIGLPGTLDGYALARRLRADPQHAGVRLVALSGYADEHARQRSREAGFDVHLAKPTDLASLRAALAPAAAPPTPAPA